MTRCIKSVLIWSYSGWNAENADQNNSEYGHFLQRGTGIICELFTSGGSKFVTVLQLPYFMKKCCIKVSALYFLPFC